MADTGYMNGNRTTKAMRAAERDIRVGKGVPGKHNGTRPAVFKDRKKEAGRKACRRKDWA